jgi:hypothetical protein
MPGAVVPAPRRQTLTPTTIFAIVVVRESQMRTHIAFLAVIIRRPQMRTEAPGTIRSQINITTLLISQKEADK